MTIRHRFNSPIPDDGVPTGAVKPSNWNDDHIVDGVLGALVALDAAGDVVPYLDSSMQGRLAKLTATGRAILACALVSDALGYLGAAPLISPALAGTPTAPTAAVGTYTDQVATMAALQNAINALIGGAPGALDTLNELAVAINNDASFATTVTNALASRLRIDAVQGSSAAQQALGRGNLGLGTSAVVDVGTGANKVVQLDGSAKLPAVDGSALLNIVAAWASITGKPTLGSASALDVGTTANKVVQLDASGKLPAVDGSQLTGISATGVIGVRKFTASGTYVPSAGVTGVIIEAVGGGGGGGGQNGGGGTTADGAPGGGYGSYSKTFATAAAIGASQTVTIGLGGAVSALGGAGGNGGTTSVGTLCVANGGVGGGAGSLTGGGPGGAAGTGDIAVPGQCGFPGMYNHAAGGVLPYSGCGGSGPFGAGGGAVSANNNATNGNPGSGYGAGGSGGATHAVTAGAVGGAGAPGFVVITEFKTH